MEPFYARYDPEDLLLLDEEMANLQAKCFGKSIMFPISLCNDQELRRALFPVTALHHSHLHYWQLLLC